MTPEVAAKKFDWIKIGEDGILEFYADHSMLSAMRACEAYFIETHTRNRRHVDRNWNFEFGKWLHSTLETFYYHEYKKLLQLTKPTFDECMKCKHPHGLHIPAGCLGKVIKKVSATTAIKTYCPCKAWEPWTYISKGAFIAKGLQLWDEMDMDYFRDKHKQFKVLDGAIGAAALLSDYYAVYGGGKERLRVVGIELPFGFKKEVPIISDIYLKDSSTTFLTQKYPIDFSWLSGIFRAYLTGRIDLLVDDLISLMVFDHKSTAFFDGSESTKFVPHEGMQGYCFGADKLLQMATGGKKNCRKVLMNHICLQQKDKNIKTNGKLGPVVGIEHRPEYRFTRNIITYTPEQLEEFRLRQAASFDVLYQLIILERPATWNTGACNNMYHKECPFKSLHGLTPSIREDIAKQQYKIVEAWNPNYEDKKEII